MKKGGFISISSALCALSLLFMGGGLYVFLITEIPSVKALKDLTNKPVSMIYGINDQVAYVVVPDNKISRALQEDPQACAGCLPRRGGRGLLQP